MAKKIETITNETESTAPVTETKAPDVSTEGKVDYVKLALEPVLNSTETDNIRWAMILKLAETHADESELPLEVVSDGEIVRRLRLLWSKRVALKKVQDAAAHDSKEYAEATAALEALQDQEDLMNSYRTNKGASHRSGAVKTDADPSKLDQLELGKLIRNLQSKKSVAKRTGKMDEAEEWQKKIDEAVKYRTESPTKAANNAINQRISAALAALELLPQTEEVTAQISALKAML